MKSPLKLKIQERAFELFLERGGTHGHMLDDWIQAEREIAGSAPKENEARHKKEVASEKK